MLRLHNLMTAAVTLGHTVKTCHARGDTERTLEAIEAQIRTLEKADRLVTEMIGLSAPAKASNLKTVNLKDVD